MKRVKDYYRGCMLGGAVGDALGWPVEFMSLNAIKQKYGEDGITDLVIGENGKAEITDDTQMSIFTADGLLRADTRFCSKGLCSASNIVYNSYKRWLYTIGEVDRETVKNLLDGWLMEVKELYAVRSPGRTCLSALKSGKKGTIEKPINNSKGCGGVMRAAPVGLFCTKETAFRLGCDIAALTHGHPSGYLSAGVLAHIITLLVDGLEIEEAVRNALEVMSDYKGHVECSSKIREALELVKSDINPGEAIKKLGEGWVGDEAIAISVYCALKSKYDFRSAIRMAVNHDGDSDSTGAITGNILGAYLGISGIPDRWVENVELSDVLIQLADDLITGFQETEEWRVRYPG